MRSRTFAPGGQSAGVILLLIATVCFLLPLFVHGEALSPRKIKVGFFFHEGYHQETPGGSRSGYGYDFMQNLAPYAGWQYAYIGYDRNWDAMQTMLLNGEIDILTGVIKTPEREQLFDFADLAMGTTSTIMTVKNANSNFMPKDYANWNNIRIGFAADDDRKQSFASFAAAKGFQFQSTLYPTTAELCQALQDETVDAAVTSSLRTTRNEWIYEQFDVNLFYAVVKKGNSELLEKLNNALMAQHQNNPLLSAELRKHYYAQAWSPQNGLSLTLPEREFIEDATKNNRRFKILLKVQQSPFASISADGKITGMMADILNLLTERTGLFFDPVGIATNQEMQQKLQSGDVDLVLDTWRDYSHAETLDLNLTTQYMTAPISILAKKTFTEIPKKIAVINNQQLLSYLRAKDGNEVEFFPYNTIDEIVAAVRSGKCDAAYLYTLRAEEVIFKDISGLLTSNILPGYSVDFAIGLKRDVDNRLFTILAKGVKSISDDTIAEIQMRHYNHNSYTVSLREWIASHPFLTFGFIVLPLSLLIMLLTALLYSRRNIYRMGVVLNKMPFRYFVADSKGNILQYLFADRPHYFSCDNKKLHSIYDCPDVELQNTIMHEIHSTLETEIAHSVQYSFEGAKRTALVMKLPKQLFHRDCIAWISHDTTELLDTREQAQILAENLQLTLQSIGDAVITTDIHGAITLLNPAAESLTKWTNAEAMGKDYTEVLRLCVPMDKTTPLNPIHEVLTTQTTSFVAEQADLLDKTDQRYNVSYTASPINNPSTNQVAGAIIVLRDVTSEMENKEKLNQALTLLEYGEFLSHGASFRKNLRTGNLVASSHLSQLWPFENGEPLSYEKWIVPEDQPRFLAAITPAISGAESSVEVIDFRSCYYNETRYYRFRAQHDATDPSNPQLIGAIQDVTAEQALSRNKRTLRECFEEILGESDPFQAISKILGIIRTSMGADRCYILRFDMEKNYAYFFVDSYHDGLTSLLDYEQTAFPFDNNSSWLKSFLDGDIIAISDIDTVRNSKGFSPWLSLTEQSDTQSLYCAGIWKEKKLWGNLGLAYSHKRNIYSSHDLAFLKSASHLIELMLERQQSRDLLVDALNRAERLNANLQDLVIQHELLLDQIPVYVFAEDINDHFRYTQCNRAFAKILGHDHQEILGKTDEEILFSPDDVLNFRIAKDNALKSDSVSDAGISFHSSDGKSRLGRFYWQTINLSANRQWLVGIGFDVTEEYENRSKLQKAAFTDSMLNVLLDTLPCQVFIKDAWDDFRYLIVNRNFTEYYHLDKSEFLGQCDSAVFAPSVSAKLRKNDTLVCENLGSVFRFAEDISYHQKGEEVFQTVKTSFKTEDGHPYLVGVCVDITDLSIMQKKLSQALQEANLAERNQKILNDCFAEIMPEELTKTSFLNILRQMCKTLHANRTYLQQFDWSKNTVFPIEEFVEGDLAKLITPMPLDAKHHNSPIFKTLLAKKLVIFHNTNENGNEFASNSIWEAFLRNASIEILYILPLFYNGKLWGCVSVCFDKSEQELSSKSIELLHAFGRMLEVLLMRQNYIIKLSDALTEAQSASRAKSEFLATVSHELRTPLNSVIGFSELLSAPDLPAATATEYVNNINIAGKALLCLINDILDLSKIEADKLQIIPGPTDMSILFHEMQSIFSQSAKAKNLTLEFSGVETMPLLILDEMRLRQILLNLIGNAVKFTPAGKVSISANYQEHTLVIAVADTGIGVEEDKQTAIFEPFVQQNALRDSKVFKGSGLGLAICKKLTEKMGGEISLQSKVGCGSVFTVRFQSIRSVPKTTAAVPKELPAVPVPIQNLRVLAVDDIPVNVQVLCAMLRKIGLTVFSADSGSAALEILNHEPIDIVFTDLWMPGMNGLELAKAIQQLNLEKKPAIVMVSAEVDVQHKMTEDIDNYLIKPITMTQVKDIVLKISTKLQS